MKKLFVFILFISLTACGGLDTFGCYESVVKRYPKSEVMQVAGHKYYFAVKKPDGEIRLVKTMNQTNVEITEDLLLFKGKAK